MQLASQLYSPQESVPHMQQVTQANSLRPACSNELSTPDISTDRDDYEKFYAGGQFKLSLKLAHVWCWCLFVLQSLGPLV